MKRAPEKQLTQLSADQEGDSGDEPTGSWQPAPPEVLAQRKIVKAHRPSERAESKPASANPMAAISFAPPAVGAPAAAPAAAGGGGCAWSLSAKQPFSFAIPPLQTSKPQPPPAACACGFFSGSSGCAWSSGGGGFASVASAAPSFSALSKAAAPATAAATTFSALAGAKVFSAALGGSGGGGGARKGGSAAAAEGGAGAGADEDEDADGDDPTADEVPIVAEPKLPIVATVTGEEDEACVHKVRAKVFVLEQLQQAAAAGGDGAGKGEARAHADGEKREGERAGATGAAPDTAAAGAAAASRWVERGVGALHLNVHRPPPSADAPPFVPGAAAHELGPRAGAQKPRPPRLVMRVEHVGRLVLNTPLLPGMPPPSRVSETSIRVNSLGNELGEMSGNGAPPPFQCLLRVKTASEAEALMHALTHAISSAASGVAAAAHRPEERRG